MDARDPLQEGPIRLITNPELSPHNRDNPALTAGFTFLGQFLAAGFPAPGRAYSPAHRWRPSCEHLAAGEELSTEAVVVELLIGG
jgi:hypothetical protein